MTRGIEGLVRPRGQRRDPAGPPGVTQQQRDPKEALTETEEGAAGWRAGGRLAGARGEGGRGLKGSSRRSLCGPTCHPSTRHPRDEVTWTTGRDGIAAAAPFCTGATGAGRPFCYC